MMMKYTIYSQIDVHVQSNCPGIDVKDDDKIYNRFSNRYIVKLPVD